MNIFGIAMTDINRNIDRYENFLLEQIADLIERERVHISTYGRGNVPGHIVTEVLHQRSTYQRCLEEYRGFVLARQGDM